MHFILTFSLPNFVFKLIFGGFFRMQRLFESGDNLMLMELRMSKISRREMIDRTLK